ncbi:MAG: BtpA/SgcQ family protein [Nanoarchaeota archaeon]
MTRDFAKLFPIKKPIIGMIHLAGNGRDGKIKRALDELGIYEEEGVDGAIIEDYHGNYSNLLDALQQSERGFKIVRGVNYLHNPYEGFQFAANYGAKFVQFDNVSGGIDFSTLGLLRGKFPNISLLGGVRFKYTKDTGNSLEKDLTLAMGICEAIVTTGEGTGIETPTDKLRAFKYHLGDFPLVVGAGVNAKNAYEQLRVCDGAIIGSYFKPNGDTQMPVDRIRVRELMDIVREVRRCFDN